MNQSTTEATVSSNLTAMVQKDKWNVATLTKIFLSQAQGNYYDKHKKIFQTAHIMRL